MKKVLAIVLALVMALSCTAIAFADDTTTSTTKATTTSATNQCPYCGATFANESEYNKHISICYSQNGGYSNVNGGYNNFFNLSAADLAENLLEFFETNTTYASIVEDLIIRLVDLIENIGTLAISKADVAGATDDLEAKIATLPLVGDVLEYVSNLMTTLKQKIKDLYANETETVAEETTAAEEETVPATDAEAPVDTGSTSVGIAAFAAISVAAATAYVCTKKKED